MKTEKPHYHQSTLTHYYVCPHKMELSRVHSIEQTMPMREGLLFEFYALGMNPRAKKIFDTPEKYELSLIGRKKPETIDPIKKKAEYVKQFFLEPQNAYQVLLYEDRQYINGGEADYVGELIYGRNRTQIRCIADLKFTSDVASWRFLNKTTDFFQSLYYCYIVWKMTGQILPFIYVVVDSSFDVPMVSFKKFTFTKENLLQLKKEVDFIHNDIIRKPKVSQETCIKGPYNKRCDYLEWCEHGRELIESSIEIEFDELIPNYLTNED